ncbi:carboxymuconolactone decarboxylase family protein [Bradyrhizobium sp. USDA 4502]
MSARILPATEPFPQVIQERLSQRKRSDDARPHLTLFTTLARDERLFRMFFAGSLLDPASTLSLHYREMVIDRISARSGSEYEWGVHVSIFAKQAELTEEQIVSTARGNADDPCWNPKESALIAACDELHDTCNLSDVAWARLSDHFEETAIMEILMLAGRYRVVSYLTNAIRMPLESWARRFP